MTYKSNEKSFFEQERAELEKIEKKGSKKFLKMYDFGASKLRAEIKKHPAQFFFLFITSFLGSIITSSVALFGFSGTIIAQFTAPHLVQKTDTPKVQSAQKVVTTEKFDHLLLAQKLRNKEKDFVIVDIRSVKDYNDGHIVTSLNIPIYGSVMVDEDGNLDKDDILASFKEKVGDDDKFIIIYGPDSYSSLPSDIAVILTTANKKAKPLAVGWEEWLHLEGN